MGIDNRVVIIFTRMFTIITVFSHNHTHLMSSSVTADWNGGHG